MKMLLRCLCLFLPVLLTNTSLTVAEDHAPMQLTAEQIKGFTPFAVVVKRNWASWSKGSDTASKMDLIARMVSPEYKGEDAAALVALEFYLRKNPAVDLAAAAGIEDVKILNLYYRNIIKLRNAKRVLFAGNRPQFELLQQGPAGDCYFFSASGWMARNRPSDVMNAITQLDDGRFRVRFANGDEATVTQPTDAELAINDSESTLQDGIWMSVLEKATGTIQAGFLRKTAEIPDPTVAIDTGGVPIGSIVKRWTGRDVKMHHLGRRGNKESIRKALVRMHERKSLATALLLHKPAAKLPYDHVYAIIDFSPLTDTLTIWNPWGTDFSPNGPSGPENGYERKKGIFYLTFDEFVAFYSYLAIEQN